MLQQQQRQRQQQRPFLMKVVPVAFFLFVQLALVGASDSVHEMNNEQQQQQQQPFSKPESATTSLVASVIDATVRLVVSIFSYTVTLSVRVPTLGTLALLIAIAGYAVFRYNLLTVYSRLPKTDPPPSRSDRVLDLQPDIAYEDILGDQLDDLVGTPELYLDGGKQSKDSNNNGNNGKKGSSRSSQKGRRSSNSNESSSGGFSSNLFDAFLSSIRVFGSLDEPVFHELSRHLQTRRLLAGDTMSEEEVDASFYIVVEGRVEVYLATPTSPGSLMSSAGPSSTDPIYSSTLGGGSLLSSSGVNLQSGYRGTPPPYNSTIADGSSPEMSESPSEQSEEAEDGLNPFDADAGIRPRLLNVVRAGERLSSMFAILSLFTNDISLDQTGDPIDPSSNIPVTTSSTNSTAMPTIATASLGATAVPSNISSPLVATAAAASAALPTLRGLDSPVAPIDPHLQYLYLLQQQQQQQQQQHQLHHHHHYQQPSVATATRQTTSSVHPDIVIRAAVDTTLAVIPAEAFRKLTRKFPGAAACIVQAILARFQRGTHLVLSEYFGLPDELVRTMRGLQSFVQRDLPDSISRSTTVSRLLAPPVAPSSSNNAGASSGSGLAAVPSSASLASMSASTADLSGYTMTATPYSPHGPRSPLSFSSHLDSVRERNTASADYSHIGSPPLMHQLPPASVSAGNVNIRSPAPRSVQPGRVPSNQHQQRSLGGLEMSAMSSGLPSAASLTGLGVLDNNSSATPTSSRLATRRRQSSSAGFRTAPTEADLRQLRGDVFDSMSTLLGMSSHASSTNGRRLSNISTGYGASPAGLNTPTQMSHNRSSRRIPSASGSKPHLSQVTNALNALPVLEQVDVELLQLDVGTVIMESGSRPDGLYYVVAGRLEAYSSRPSKSDSLDTSSPNSARLAYAVTPGGLAGYFESLTDMPAVVTVRSVQPTIVGFIPKSALERLSDRNPTALLLLAKRLISRLSSLALHIDFAIEWVQVEAGQVIYRQGDSASAAYIVASGRLRAIHVSRGPGSVGAVSTAGLTSAAVAARKVHRRRDDIDHPRNHRPDDDTSGTNRELHIDIRGEYGQGESLGELEVLTGGSRLATLHAIRDSEVARMPHSMFDALAQRYPVLAMRISRVLATRAQKPQSNPNASSGPSSKAALAVDASRPTVSTTLLSESGDANYNLRTIALVPTDASVPIAAFAQRLHDALVSVGASVAVLDYRTVIRMMGRHTFSRFGELRLLAYLAELEQRVSTVLYVADSPAASPWTKRCIRQADCVLLVANGDSANQEIGAYERVLLGIKTTARKELVLLHGERLVPHGSTRAWLQRRVWIHAHHHVHMPLHAAQDHLANPDPDGFDLGTDILRSLRPHSHGSATDLASLNYMSDDEATTTSDIRNATGGGSSKSYGSLFDNIGSDDFGYTFVANTANRIFGGRPGHHGHGGLRSPPTSPILGTLLRFGGRVRRYYTASRRAVRPVPRAYRGMRSDFARLARRLTGQSVGVVLSGGGARGMAHIGMLRAMEDAGVPVDMIGGTSIGSFMGGLYAGASDSYAIMRYARMFAQRTASMWRQALDLTYPVTAMLTGHELNRSTWKVFADTQIEDLWLPYFCVTTNITHSRAEVHQTGYLWRYVRASMTLAGYMPPLCDNGNMLVDGGYLDNMPVGIMRSLGAKTIVAIDVSRQDDTSPHDFGDSLSGFRVLASRWNPFRWLWYYPNPPPPPIPDLAEIQSRLAYVSSVRERDLAIRTPGCLYIRVPIQQYATLEFGKFQEILDKGHAHGKRVMKQWEERGILNTWRPKNTAHLPHIVSAQSAVDVTRPRSNNPIDAGKQSTLRKDVGGDGYRPTSPISAASNTAGLSSANMEKWREPLRGRRNSI